MNAGMNVIDMTRDSPVDGLITTTNNVPNTPVSNNDDDDNNNGTTTIPDTFVQNDDNDATALPYILVKQDKKKKFGIPKIFSAKRNGRCKSHENIPTLGLSRSERQSHSHIEVLDLSNFKPTTTEIQNFRIFVATWNVGGKTPTSCLNLEDFLQGEDTPDIYVIGFQEVVPLSAGNVLVHEDSEPAAKWLVLIGRALNDPQADDSSSLNSDSSHSCRETKTPGSHAFSQKQSLKAVTRTFGADTRLLKSCNCPLPIAWERPRPPARKLSEPMNRLEELYVLTDIGGSSSPSSPASPVVSPSKISYRLIACKQMVGIFLAVWARKELVQHIGHLRVSNLGRGVMGCLGNKGCISVSMTLHQTSFCFVCTHLASGEKEGDELRRNADVAEILKGTHFPKICRNPGLRIPERIIDHDRIIWLGDLNYRMALSYDETKVLLDDNNWDSLLEKDQLNIERKAGRVFTGTWNEGRILFAPTYKYTHNSDSYAGETVKSKKKRRTPSWCDRILWRGDKIEQLAYIRGESRFSDHRPVCAVFTVGVELKSRDTRFQKGYSCTASRFGEGYSCTPSRFGGNDLTAQRHGF